MLFRSVSPDRLYGMAYFGGDHGYGTIFYVQYPNGSGWQAIGGVTKIHDFDGIRGANPNGDLLLGSDGLMYGLTTNGGAYQKGVVFRIDPNINTYEVIFNFRNDSAPGTSISSGSLPYGNLIQTSNGSFYGMTASGLAGLYTGTI